MTHDASTSDDAAENVPVSRFIKEWSAAHQRRDANALAAMYGDRVSFYGERRSRDEVIAVKRSTFESVPQYSHQVLGINTRVGLGDYTVSTFLTVAGGGTNPKPLQTKLVLGQSDGGPPLILEEAGEAASDEQNEACDSIAGEVTNSLPMVKRYRAQVEARANANDKLRIFGIGPQDLSDPSGFFASTLVAEGDEAADTVVEYRVDREGLLSVIVGHEGSIRVPREALRKVEKACKR